MLKTAAQAQNSGCIQRQIPAMIPAENACAWVTSADNSGRSKLNIVSNDFTLCRKSAHFSVSLSILCHGISTMWESSCSRQELSRDIVIPFNCHRPSLVHFFLLETKFQFPLQDFGTLAQVRWPILLPRCWISLPQVSVERAWSCASGGGEQVMCGLWTVLQNLDFLIFLKVPGFWIQIF